MPVIQTENIPIHFIVSTGRTGSTLLSSMLNAHPEVISISEEPFCLNLYDGYKNETNWTDDTIRKFVHDFLLFSSGKLGPQFGTPDQLIQILVDNREKMDFQKAVRLCYFAFFPLKDKSSVKILVSKELIYHNKIRTVLKLYPAAKFILLVRDPRDNVSVKIRRAERRGAFYSVPHFILAWKIVYSMLYENLMRYGKGRFIVTKYESLVTDPQAELKNISAFLGISYNDCMLTYDEKIKQELAVQEKKLSPEFMQHMKRDHDGLTQKVYTDKINLWKKTLTEEQANLVWSVTGKLAEKFGYSRHTGCKKANAAVVFFFRKLYFIYKGIVIPKLYYGTPWAIRRLMKKIKYGKAYVESGYKEDGFYKNPQHAAGR